MIKVLFFLCTGVAIFSCNNNADDKNKGKDSADTKGNFPSSYIEKNLAGYAKVRLTTDLSRLTEKEKKMIPLLVSAAKIMDDLYWEQSFGNKDSLLNSITDEKAKQFVIINYGPWDKLNNDTPFVAGVGAKPPGAQFYPADMTKDELEKSNVTDKHALYSVIRRDSTGKLISIPYHVAYKQSLQKASSFLKQAAELAEDAGLKKYLNLRAEALLTDKYDASDIAWLDMKNNSIDVIIGPI
jgi:hypothetical protein